MTQILSFSLIIWILIDRFKGAWEHLPCKSYITSGLALLLGGAVAIFYRLDIIVALGLAEETSALGIILTALSLMGGSSCIAEIIENIGHPFGKPTEVIKHEISLHDLIGSDEDDDEETEGGQNDAE